MEKSIESIWKEGFLNKDALIAPKINDLYNRKSKHIVDKFKRMYTINIRAIIVFAILVLPFTFITDMPYMGIPICLIFIGLAIISSGLKNQLSNIDTNVNSFQYLHSFNSWVKNMVAFNAKISTYLYPTIFLAMMIGFWFGSIGGDIPGEKFISWLLMEFPNSPLLFGLPVYLIIGVITILVLLAYFGGRIGTWDINLVYGRILKKLDVLVADIEELSA